MRTIISLIFFSVFLLSCKEEIYSTIPNAPVDVKLDLKFDDSNLNASLAHLSLTKARNASDKIGYGGILIVNGFGASPVSLYAYDLACPVEATRTTKVIPDNEGYCTCPKCGTKYNIANGSGNPVSGGGKYFLRSYTVADTGNNTYRVVNRNY